MSCYIHYKFFVSPECVVPTPGHGSSNIRFHVRDGEPRSVKIIVSGRIHSLNETTQSNSRLETERTLALFVAASPYLILVVVSVFITILYIF